MAKKRKSIHAIQKALMENTEVLGDTTDSAPCECGCGQQEEEPAAPPIAMDAETVRLIRILAEYQQTTPEALVQLALDDLLALRSRQLSEALKQRGEQL